MSNPNRVRSLVGTVALLVGLSTVAACGDNGTTVTTKDGSVTVDGDTATVETSEGTATIGKGLPDGFPKDDVPLVDDKVLSGVKGSSGGPFAWSVVMQTSKSISDVTAEVKKDFADAGYTTGQGTEMGDVAINQFTSSKYEVSVTAAHTGGSVTITYLVKNAG